MDNLSNPFTNSDCNGPIATTSPLDYGDYSCSFFNRLQSSSRLYRSQVNQDQRSTQDNILKMYEKQLYTIDDDGHCPAQIALDMLTEDSEKKEDFWLQIKKKQPLKDNMNPLNLNGKNGYKSAVSSNRLTQSAVGNSIPMNPKSKKQTARSQLIKLKEIKKIQQIKCPKQVSSAKFSLINLFKKRDEKIENLATITFLNVNQFQQVKANELVNQKQQIAVIPKMIRINSTEYYYVPFQ